MGKGDIKSKKGKITNGSFGKRRKHKPAKEKAAAQAPAPGKAPAAKAPAAPTQ
jgi:30S ribosomal protein S31